MNPIFLKEPEGYTFKISFVVDTDGKIIGGRVINKNSIEQWSPQEKAFINIIESDSTLMWKSGKCFGKTGPVLVSIVLRTEGEL